jgi:ferredoxin--NADP+ reductase
MEAYKKHYIAVIGGSISGSEAANLLAQNGFKVVVFEMNKLPYGKIEDGLPSWHISLRDRQQKEIDKKLNQENIRYVPQVKIGKDISFKDLVENWGFSAIILANGAWQDRTLNINGIEKFKNKGLIYQNDFIYWFNHKHEPNFDGNRYSLKDGAAVVGGGLASLDVVKVFMIELVREKLIELFNINSDVFTIEKYGIDKLLEEYNIAFEALKLKGATLVYRRTAADMPLKDPKDDTPENIKKAREISEKLLNKYIEKFKFNFKPLSIPVDFIEEDKQFKGLVLQSVEVREGKIIPIENKTEILSTEMLVSSIGSLPEEIDGLQYEWSALKMRKDVEYHVFGYDNVFAIGNAITGRGNIQDSKQHGKKMTRKIIDHHLTEDAFEKWLNNLNESIKEKVTDQMDSIIDKIKNRELQSVDIIQRIIDKTQELNNKNGFKTYSSWIAQHTPIRLEELIKNNKA